MSGEALVQPEQPLGPNEAQESTLRTLCTNYHVDYAPEHYLVYPPDSIMMPGWAEGWLGGEPGSLYVGVSPEGQAHS